MEGAKILTLAFGIIFGCGWLLSLFHIYYYYHALQKGWIYKGMMPIGTRIILNIAMGAASLLLILKG